VGTYNLIAETFSLTIDQFDLNASGFLTAHASTVLITYDSQVVIAQTLVTIPALDPETALNVTDLAANHKSGFCDARPGRLSEFPPRAGDEQEGSPAKPAEPNPPREPLRVG